jgi:hypothetical protein
MAQNKPRKDTGGSLHIVSSVGNMIAPRELNSVGAKAKNVVIPKILTAYDIFVRCIKRAENLINFHSDDKNPDEEHFCDAYRASVVLTIAALDAYTRTVAIIKIKEKLKKKPKPTDSLWLYIKSIMDHDSLLECAMNDSFFSEIENQITNDFQKKSFQGERKITHYMELAGYKNIIGMVSKKSNSNEENLKQSIDKFTKRRHTIAHGGDYDITQIPYKELEIKKEFAVECHKIVSQFTTTLNDICFNK